MRRIAGLIRNMKANRGSIIIEVLVCITLITFVMLYPLFTYSYTNKINLLEDVSTMGLQMIAVEGGLTDQVAEIIYLNLEQKRMIPPGDAAARSKVIITSNADARNNNKQALKYRDSADPKLYLKIQYPATKEVQFMNGLSRMIGAGNNLPFETSGGTVTYYYEAQGYIMSEKIDY